MAITNHERVGKAMELLKDGLTPFVEREMEAALGDKWKETARQSVSNDKEWQDKKGKIKWDSQRLLQVMWRNWNEVFHNTLGKAERSLVSELQDARNQWAHQEAFSTDDGYRVLDSIYRLLTSISAKESEDVDKMKQEVLRVRFDEQARWEKRKTAAVVTEGQPQAGLKPWREVITPHPDVSSGKFQQAEFAADLARVAQGQGGAEYRNPKDFFQRTFPTEGLKHLLKNALIRLSGKGGDPVVELQTNFGGGKTHCMIALYHLFSGAKISDLVGMEEILRDANIKEIPNASRAVLVGSSLSPGKPTSHEDGVKTHTLWGEMAYQLGGKDGYKMVADSDKKGVAPGSRELSELFIKFGPCLILIDEWITFVRQLYNKDKDELPAGSFEANMSFAQNLSEAAKIPSNTLLVASIPSSEIEIGGKGGEEALIRIRNVLGRVESTWKPASAEEGFEIVRRRLFQPINDNQRFVESDAVINSFCKMYDNNKQEFPSGVCEADYKDRMRRAYPIHPEMFDRLYEDWATLDRFQLTRGVLRLMAEVIRELWERNDSNLLIMPSSIPIDSLRVRNELTRYLDDNWGPIIESEVDGQNSLPLAIDRENPNLGRYSACRRVARTIYLGSAPLVKSNNQGVSDQRIKLGCAQPGENIPIFGDALRRLIDDSNYVHVDGKRYWYSTQATPTKIAKDRAKQLEEYKAHEEIKRRLRQDRSRGDFVRVHSVPESSNDVPDDMEARLVILGPEFPHMGKSQDSPALKMADEILNNRGTSPRQYSRNMLVFAAPDHTRLKELEQAVCSYLAWESIVRDKESLNLDAFNLKLSETKKGQAEQAVVQRIKETYVWALVPTQPDPNGALQWQDVKVQIGPDELALRISKKLKSEEHLITQYSGTRLKMELDKYIWKDADHVSLKKLWEYFASYLYFPRLKDSNVLAQAVEDGISDLTWSENFAYAEGWDEKAKRYLNLKAGVRSSVIIDSQSLIVKPDAANKQIEADKVEREKTKGISETGGGKEAGKGAQGVEGAKPPARPTRFYGTVHLDPLRLKKELDNVADEIVQHITALAGTEVEITLEIQARIPQGVPENVERTVTENCRTLKFKNHGFEEK